MVLSSKHNLNALLSACFLAMVLQIDICQGHGYLKEPPSRSFLGKDKQYCSDIEGYFYDVIGLNCGSIAIHYHMNDGKCGMCGDRWDKPTPRMNEAGGKYGTSDIGQKYTVSQEIDVVVDLVASHGGYFEFRLCASDDPSKKVTQACLDQNVLLFAAENQPKKAKYTNTITNYNPYVFNLKVQLPQGLRCRACVLQWKYKTGDINGKASDGSTCLGCGDQQTFYNCANVAIGYDDVAVAVAGPVAGSCQITTNRNLMVMLAFASSIVYFV